MNVPQGTVELGLVDGFGSDFDMQGPGDPNPGDFKLLIDTDQAAPATRQRFINLLNISPRGQTSTGAATRPDDPFFPYDGAGLPQLVGEQQDDALRDEITTRIKRIGQRDPGVAPSPETAVVVDFPDPSTTLITIEYDSITGAPQSIPNLDIQALNASGG